MARNEENRYIKEQLRAFDADLLERRAKALKRFSKIAGPSSIHQFHAHIGRNNNTFVDSVRTQFASPDDFIARWMDGLTEHVRTYMARKKQFGAAHWGTERILIEVMRDPFLREYTYRFLERNFYRNFDARIRAKPDEILWSLWFGSGNLVWGLIISPARRLGEWTNDKSQMRREDYQYWTVGHVMQTGLIDPEQTKPHRFAALEDFYAFYRSVLTRVSNSVYEKKISNRYIEYLEASDEPLAEPLLIPELRYAGKEQKHEHRLDFTVLNPYVMSMTGFELSPASSHMAISGIKSKKQVHLNKDLSARWAKEMKKRNAYFETFGISTVTFADDDLGDIDACFQNIREVLEARPDHRVSLVDAQSMFDKACDDLGL